MNICRLCESNKIKKVFDFGMHTVVNKVDAAKIHLPLANFKLYECRNCGFLQMPNYFLEQTKMYENYITLSSYKEQPHVLTIFERIKQFKGKFEELSLLDIGCNDGGFLSQAKKLGFKNIFGIEPTKDAYKECLSKQIPVINQFFSSNLNLNLLSNEKFDVIVSRQVLEHIEDINDFVKTIKNILSKDGILLIEIPDHSMNYENLDYSFWEEHVNYFTISTLRNLLRSNELNIFHHETCLYSGGCLMAYISHSSNKKKIYRDFDKYYRTKFVKNFNEFRKEFINYLEKFNDKKIYIYGYGCRSANIVNLLNLNDYIEGFIDDNPVKSGKIAPLSNLKIFNFHEINKIQEAHLLLAVNSEAEEKIISKIKKHNLTYDSILPPSPRLPYFWRNLIERNCLK